jgi:hypothetical protein
MAQKNIWAQIGNIGERNILSKLTRSDRRILTSQANIIQMKASASYDLRRPAKRLQQWGGVSVFIQTIR